MKDGLEGRIGINGTTYEISEPTDLPVEEIKKLSES